MKKITVIALIALAVCSSAYAADWNTDGRIILPLYFWSGDGSVAPPAGTPQVGTVTLTWCETGELGVQVEVDDAAPCQTYAILAKVDGRYHSEDSVLLATNVDRQGLGCTSLTMDQYAAAADAVIFQVVVQPQKEGIPCSYATPVERVPLPGTVVTPIHCVRHPAGACNCVTSTPVEVVPTPATGCCPNCPCAQVQRPGGCIATGTPVVIPQPYCETHPYATTANPCACYAAPRTRVIPAPTGAGGGGTGAGAVAVAGPSAVASTGGDATATTTTTGHVISAQGFQLVDQTGTPRGTLHLNNSGVPELVLMDSRSQRRAVLGLQPDGSPQLDLLGVNGQSRLGLAALADGSLSVAMLDGSGAYRALIGLDDTGSPLIQMLDNNMTVRAELGLGTQGEPALRLMDSNAMERATLGLQADGTPLLGLRKANGKNAFKKP